MLKNGDPYRILRKYSSREDRIILLAVTNLLRLLCKSGESNAKRKRSVPFISCAHITAFFVFGGNDGGSRGLFFRRIPFFPRTNTAKLSRFRPTLRGKPSAATPLKFSKIRTRVTAVLFVSQNVINRMGRPITWRFHNITRTKQIVLFSINLCHTFTPG